MSDAYVGQYVVLSLDYFECDRCGDRLFSPKAARLLETQRAKTLDTILKSKPIAAFMTSAQASSFLSISRQALHKHRRIRQGFIFHTNFGKNTAYLRKSVELFKASGDGRFPLCKSEKAASYMLEEEARSAANYISKASSAFFDKLFDLETSFTEAAGGNRHV